MDQDKFITRKLEIGDYMNSYLSLLKQYFTIDITSISFTDFKDFIHKLNINHQVFIAEHIPNDKLTNKHYLVGSITVLIEQKIIHNMGKVAHIEDVIIHEDYRKKGLGKMLINKCIEYAKQNNCYKAVLYCENHNIDFYENCGFKKNDNESLNIYF
tara:strand:- start:4059 stop:4526 length:468 start_codon:yes stop_codon:yes gene_type:complete